MLIPRVELYGGLLRTGILICRRNEVLPRSREPFASDWVVARFKVVVHVLSADMSSLNQPAAVSMVSSV